MAVLVCLAISHVALQVGDRRLAAMVLCLVGATFGFLVWNYLRGKIAAGYGWPYVWGMAIAVAVVTLVRRYRVVSPWFPILLLIYCVLRARAESLLLAVQPSVGAHHGSGTSGPVQSRPSGRQFRMPNRV